MHIIIDFDYTLFDTKAFIEKFEYIFLCAGVEKNIFLDSFQKMLKWKEGKLGYNYSFERHIDFLKDRGYKFNIDILLKDLYGCIDRNFLYDDAISFLEFSQSEFTYNTLMTAGNEHFQKTKVERVVIKDFFSDIIFINGNKHLYIRDNMKNYSDIIFINDNLEENIMLQKTLPEIHIITKYNRYKYTKQDAILSGIPFFETLSEIQTYVTQKFI